MLAQKERQLLPFYAPGVNNDTRNVDSNASSITSLKLNDVSQQRRQQVIDKVNAAFESIKSRLTQSYGEQLERTIQQQGLYVQPQETDRAIDDGVLTKVFFFFFSTHSTSSTRHNLQVESILNIMNSQRLLDNKTTLLELGCGECFSAQFLCTLFSHCRDSLSLHVKDRPCFRNYFVAF
jgi:hypothetical protein